MSDEEDIPEFSTLSDTDEASTSTTWSAQIKIEETDEFPLDDDEASTLSLLPKKSAKKYAEAYNIFLEWKRKNNVTSFSEDALLEYFDEQSKRYNPSSMWTHYSMLRSTIEQRHNVNIYNYLKLKAFLKEKSMGYQVKKTNTFSARDINTFVNTAPDDTYLAIKVKFQYS